MFLMIPRIPTSNLFPTRRSSDLGATFIARTHAANVAHMMQLIERAFDRSEEHTSELQSHSELVCRLLLEKKNTRWQETAVKTSSLPITYSRATYRETVRLSKVSG